MLAHYPPSKFSKPLEAAAATHYSAFYSLGPKQSEWELGTRFKEGYVVSNLVPSKGSFFALTSYHTEASLSASMFSAWEYKDGKWSWIFDYPPNLSDDAREQLFVKNHLSHAMRERFEYPDY